MGDYAKRSREITLYLPKGGNLIGQVNFEVEIWGDSREARYHIHRCDLLKMMGEIETVITKYLADPHHLEDCHYTAEYNRYDH
jgi:hypothetical protein